MFKNIIYAKTCYQSQKIITGALIANKILVAIIPSILMIAVARLIDSLSTMGNGIIYMVFVVLLFSAGWILDKSEAYIKEVLKLKLSETFDVHITNIISEMKYSALESSDTQDLLKRITSKPSEEVCKGLYNLLDITEYFLRIGSILIVVGMKIWWLPFVFLAVTIPLAWASWKSGQQDYDSYREVSKHLRRADYFSKVMSSREYSQERINYKYQEFFRGKWKEEYEKAQERDYRITKKNFIRMKASSVLTVTAFFSVALIMIIPLSNNEISIGYFIAFMTASNNLIRMMTWRLIVVIRDLKRYREYHDDIAKVHEKNSSGSLAGSREERFDNIELKDICFGYPGTDKEVLKRVSLKMEKGKSYALVGANGAGKSTLVKLILGLYDEYEGSIIFGDKTGSNNEINIMDKSITAIFQDYAKYNLTIREYLELEAKNVDDAEIESVLTKMNLSQYIYSLELGLDSKLGKIWNEGKELSGGQWQKLAIAKSILGKKSLVIMDEPTASIDPVQEKAIYDDFLKLEKDNIILLITHRLGGAKKADHIFVLDEGIISEEGTHDMLMDSKGLYHDMYETQRAWYHD